MRLVRHGLAAVAAGARPARGGRGGAARRLAGLALFAALALPTSALAGPEDDPHGRPDRCDACHEPAEAGQTVGRPSPSVAACTACHPGRERDMHAVGMEPLRSAVPQGWPTEGGAVVCSTCHAEPACDDQRSEVKPWLRGGPYPRPADACFACHVPLEYQQVDPHHPATDRDPDDRSCAACHTTLPETGAPPSEAGLRADPQTLCAICHQESMHEGAAAHLGRALPEDVAVDLPVDSGGGIACWTCHELHGDGRLVPDQAGTDRAIALAILDQVIGAQWIRLLPEAPDWPGRPAEGEHDPMLARPVTGDQLCSICHGAGPGAHRSAP